MAYIVEIQDFSDPALDVYARLTENQLKNRLRPEEGLFIAESPKVICTALDAGLVPVSLLTERRHITGQAAALLEEYARWLEDFSTAFSVKTVNFRAEFLKPDGSVDPTLFLDGLHPNREGHIAMARRLTAFLNP